MGKSLIPKFFMNRLFALVLISKIIGNNGLTFVPNEERCLDYRHNIPLYIDCPPYDPKLKGIIEITLNLRHDIRQRYCFELVKYMCGRDITRHDLFQAWWREVICTQTFYDMHTQT